MRTRILTILGVVLFAVFTSQMGTADARSVRKVTRAPHPVNQQFRDGVGSRLERQGVSAPTASGSRSCDVFWCYGN